MNYCIQASKLYLGGGGIPFKTLKQSPLTIQIDD